jgi:hypothetical protein
VETIETILPNPKNRGLLKDKTMNNNESLKIKPLESGTFAVHLETGYLFKAHGIYEKKKEVPKVANDSFILQLTGERKLFILYIGENSWKKVAGQKLLMEAVKNSEGYKKLIDKADNSLWN